MTSLLCQHKAAASPPADRRHHVVSRFPAADGQIHQILPIHVQQQPGQCLCVCWPVCFVGT